MLVGFAFAIDMRARRTISSGVRWPIYEFQGLVKAIANLRCR